MRGAAWLAALALLGGCNLTRIGLARSEREARRAGLVEHHLDTGSCQLRYWAGGEGPPLLLLHGFGGDGPSTWRGQLRPFAAAHRLVVPDLVWFGESACDATPSLETQADAMLAILDDAGVARADVVNVSYGGFVTLGLLERAPERVGRVVFQDSPGPLFTEAEEAALLERFGVASVEDLFVPTTPAGAEVLIDLTLYEDPSIPGFVLRDLHRNLFLVHPDARRALLADLRARRGAEIPLPEAPLVVWGRHDPVFPLHLGEALAERTGGALVVIEAAEHGPSAEHPERFNAAVLRFLGGGEGGARAPSAGPGTEP